MHKEKKETERERMERLSREYSDVDWVGLYISDKLSSSRGNELSLYNTSPTKRSPAKGRKLSK